MEKGKLQLQLQECRSRSPRDRETKVKTVQLCWSAGCQGKYCWNV